jgi:glutamyl-tRNA synthetase
VRLAVPERGTTVVNDLVRGPISWENRFVEDQVLLKSDGFPTYHFAVVVDDHLMDISHILRGEDWIPSTPKQILLYQAFGWEIPQFVHLPLVNGEDGRKLGKRHGATSVTAFEEGGYLPEALFNFLALLGWSAGAGEEGEIFSREELVRRFRLEAINKSPAVFAYAKLDWMNGVYIRALSHAELAARVEPFLRAAGLAVDRERLALIVPHIQERIKTLREAVDMAGFVFAETVTVAPEALAVKGTTPDGAAEALRRSLAALEALPAWDEAGLEQALRALAGELGLKPGTLFGVVRVAATGRTVTPPLFASLHALGREATLRRLGEALQVLV